MDVNTKDFMSISEGFQQVNHAYRFGDISDYEREIFIEALTDYYSNLVK